jgi:hypothetical protein
MREDCLLGMSRNINLVTRAHRATQQDVRAAAHHVRAYPLVHARNHGRAWAIYASSNRTAQLVMIAQAYVCRLCIGVRERVGCMSPHRMLYRMMYVRQLCRIRLYLHQNL